MCVCVVVDSSKSKLDSHRRMWATLLGLSHAPGRLRTSPLRMAVRRGRQCEREGERKTAHGEGKGSWRTNLLYRVRPVRVVFEEVQNVPPDL